MTTMILSIGGALFLILLFAPFAFWGHRLLQNFKEFSRPVQLTMLLILAWQIFQLVLYFPGLISIDDRFLWKDLQSTAMPSSWHSLTYSLITMGWSSITGGPFHLSSLNLVFFGFLLFMTFRVLPSNLSKWTLLGLAVLFSMPQSSSLVLLQNRDSLNSLLLLWIFLGLLAQKTPAQKDPWFHPWTLMTLSLVLGDLRPEGKFLLLATPFALWWGQEKPFSSLLQRTAILLVGGFCLYALPAQILGYSPYTSSYRSTLFLNPLSHVFHSRGMSAATPEEIQSIEKLVLISDLTSEYTPLDIGPFHQGKIKTLQPEDVKEVEKNVSTVLWKNKDLVLENRWNMAIHLLNFQGSPYFLDPLPASASPMAMQHYEWMTTMAYGLPRSLHSFLSTCLVPLAVFLFGLSYFRTRPEVFSVAAINLFRLSLVIVATPAAYFKYVLSFWVFGWILLFYLLEKKKGSDEPLHQ